MTKMLGHWLVTFVAVLIVSLFLPFVHTTVAAAALFALVLGLVNAFIRPVLLILTLPLSILTLGLFALVVNLLMFWLAKGIVPGFEVGGGLLGLAVAAVAVSIVSAPIGVLVRVK